MRLVIVGGAIASLLLSACGWESGEGVEVAEFVDLELYSGPWFEIARIPNRFQAECATHASASYRLLEGGQLEVINRCITDKGEEKRAEGIARRINPHSNAKLEVSFVSLLGIPLFWGDYWILGLGSDYEYVVVGTPSRTYGWILAREHQLERSQWKAVDAVLLRNGYRKQDFVLSSQLQTATP